jgi:type VI secretion system protein
MGLRLEIISQHRQILGERGVKEFGRNGGTIGRSLQSDWVLPDGQRYLSSRHAGIDFRSGSYYIVDTSMNGVFVNGASRPVGRGKPQRLFSGDKVRIGEYEMLVHIDEIDNTSDQLADDQHRDPVDLAQRVAPPDPTGHDLVDPFEITGVGFEEFIADGDDIRTLPHGEIELRLEEEDSARRPARATAAPEPPPVSAAAVLEAKSRANNPQAQALPAPAARPRSEPKSAVSEGAPASAAHAETPARGIRTGAAVQSRPATPATVGSTPLEAFFHGAGLTASALSDEQAVQMMHRVGQLMRELIVGITESLHVRAEQKNALRLPNTTIQPKSNNPLKFSAGVEEALNNLLFKQSPEYLGSVEAVREALRDIKTHQQIMLAALPTAIGDYIGLLEPEDLERKFSGSSKRGGLLNAANKFKYWDLYKDLYQIVAQHAPGELPAQFVEELARAYELEAERVSGPRDRRRAHAG